MSLLLKVFSLAGVLFLVCVSPVLADSRISAQYPGATVIKKGVVPLQNSATALLPANLDALFVDIPSPHWTGCLVTGNEVYSPPCVYGNKSSSTSVVLFGDSKAMQYFAPLEKIALARNWRLTVLTRGNCPWSDGIDPDVAICNQWRANTLNQIEQQEKPDLVVLASSTHYVFNHGNSQGSKWMKIYTQKGIEVIKRLKRTGSKVVVMREQSPSKFLEPGDTEQCIRDNMNSLLNCAWTPGGRNNRAFELAAAKATKTATIDVESHICRPSLCPMVIGNIVVNRDRIHYTSSFTETLHPWLDQQIKRAVGTIG